MTKKLLYFWWGFLSDKIDPNDVTKDISSPCGDWSYLWSVFQEFQKRGWETYGVIDRDKEIVNKYGKNAFASFSEEKRFKVYNNLKWVDLNDLPTIDLLIIQNRFPTKDNSLPKNHPNYSPDLEIQEKLLNHYNNKTKIVLWDLDFQLTEEYEKKYNFWKIIETSVKPRRNHIRVFIPFDFNDILQFPTLMPYYNQHLVYCGSDYNRCKDIETKIVPYSNKYPGKIHFWGNWLKDSQKEFREKNKNIVFHDRIGGRRFREVYSRAIAVPLLSMEEYKKFGHMVMRILESILFGSIPIGFSDFYGIDKFLPKELIVDMDNYEKSMEDVMNHLKYMGYLDRINLRKRLVEKLRKNHDAKNFVDNLIKIEKKIL